MKIPHTHTIISPQKKIQNDSFNYRLPPSFFPSPTNVKVRTTRIITSFWTPYFKFGGAEKEIYTPSLKKPFDLEPVPSAKFQHFPWSHFMWNPHTRINLLNFTLKNCRVKSFFPSVIHFSNLIVRYFDLWNEISTHEHMSSSQMTAKKMWSLNVNEENTSRVFPVILRIQEN